MDKVENIASLDNLLPLIKGHKKIVLAPLDWGLGHATRCIPIIDFLLKHDIEIIIAAENAPLKILQKQFPDLVYFQLGAKPITYKSRNMLVNLILQSPRLLKNYISDKKSANSVAKKTAATCIISDNRFGFYSSGITNLYLCHQIVIHHKISLFSEIATWLHRQIMSQYDEVVIPDYKGKKSLAGKLSHTNLPNTTYIGPITRIKAVVKPIRFDVAIILSGVEPARTLFEEQILNTIIQMTSLKIVLVRGTNHALETAINFNKITNVQIIDFADTVTIDDLLNSSRILISRPGYTTLMDIGHLTIPAILIPTPSQTEQEYLANYSIKNKRFHQLSQDKIEKLPTLITTILGQKNQQTI